MVQLLVWGVLKTYIYIYLFIKCIFQLQFERCNTKKQKIIILEPLNAILKSYQTSKYMHLQNAIAFFFQQKVKLNKHLLLLLKLNYIIYMHISHTHTHKFHLDQNSSLSLSLSLSFILSPLLFYLCLFVY